MARRGLSKVLILAIITIFAASCAGDPTVRAKGSQSKQRVTLGLPF
ncbi:MAG: hypothetical protein GY791_01560 [Alphaproteobacteria bacterium]|nr:hypothetical protein [Alphaproteobacteria bacterium]